MLPASRWMRQVREHLMPITCGVGFPGRSRWPRTARLSRAPAPVLSSPCGLRGPGPCPALVLWGPRGEFGSPTSCRWKSSPVPLVVGSSVMGMGTGAGVAHPSISGDNHLCNHPHHGWSTCPCRGLTPPGHNRGGSSHRALMSAAVKWVQAVVLTRRLFGALHVSTAPGCRRQERP